MASVLVNTSGDGVQVAVVLDDESTLAEPRKRLAQLETQVQLHKQKVDDAVNIT